jgi:hypothetical protein
MEVERDEVRKREKMRVVGTQNGPMKTLSAPGVRSTFSSSKAVIRFTVKVRNACQHLRHVVLPRDECLPAPRQDSDRVNIEISRVCERIPRSNLQLAPVHSSFPSSHETDSSPG